MTKSPEIPKKLTKKALKTIYNTWETIEEHQITAVTSSEFSPKAEIPTGMYRVIKKFDNNFIVLFIRKEPELIYIDLHSAIVDTLDKVKEKENELTEDIEKVFELANIMTDIQVKKMFEDKFKIIWNK